MRTVITSKSSRKLNLRELTRFKDLLFALALRDLRVRYAQTILGFAWAIIKPLTTILILTIIFSRAMKLDTGNIPYPVFAMAGMSAWSYFAFVMTQSGNSIIFEKEIVKKIYFPRIIIPMSKSLVGLADLTVTLILLLCLMIYHGLGFSITILFLPLFIFFNIMLSLGAGIWLSALTIRFRDFQFVVPFLTQVGLYATPVAYPVSLIPKEYVLIYYLNPMAGIVEGCRWAFLGVGSVHELSAVSFALCIVIFVSGVRYFKKTERKMADLL